MQNVSRRTAVAGLGGLGLMSLLRPAGAQAPGGQPVGKLTIGLSSLGTAEVWVPWAEAGREGWLGMEAIYESLATNDAKGNFIPQLAERWEIGEGGQRWHFWLRKGVKFHDGGDFTADDLVYSHEAMVADKSVSSTKPVLKALVKSIEVIGPHEVVYHLSQKDVTFLGRVAQGNFGVVSKAYTEKVGEREAAAKPIGTGPYKMIEHKRQQSVIYEAVVPHYLETAFFKSVVLRRVPDQSARLAMLRSGEIDITEIPFKLKRESEAAGLKIMAVPGAAVYHVQLGGQLDPKREGLFDKSVPWVGEPGDAAAQERARKVRMALNLAVDKSAIIKAIFEGEGVPIASPYFLGGSEFVPGDLKAPAYDPKEAKRLLAEAGYEKGFAREIEMLLMPWPGRAEMADVGEVVAGFWERNLGLKVKRRPMDWATFAPNYGASRKMAWVCWAHGSNPRYFPDPINSMDSWLLSNSRYNSVAELPVIDDLASKIRSEVDREKRVAIYRQMAKVWNDGWHAVTIASVPALYAYNPKKIAGWGLPPGEAYIGGYHRAVPVT